MLPNLLPPLCVSLCYQEAENLVATVVPAHLAAAVPEVAVYLKEAVGNSTRIDYGTGICCWGLWMAGALLLSSCGLGRFPHSLGIL